ncbi:Ca2+-transporting ATPase [Mycoplasmopsis mustelae]|uniref:Ca2+-transporting ATPase n=1 Tax=Mycoplasmopsis mustelae TaxID=171289 RepID=A0A4R7UE96_9BACT|nr:cation-translocating P-type ATPase [Mycoplasmopsis mustelae]TDV23304.1 Ca2+-transporting ATPase [Mycoplasmopsis mustelae]
MKENHRQLGLTTAEALSRQKKFGLNKIHSDQKLNIFKIFLNQFKDFMIILLLIAALFSLTVAFYETFANKPGTQQIVISFVEPLIILIVIILNSMLGTYQEIKSNQAVKALEKNNELTAKVYRDGVLVNIPATELVVGDVIVLEAGDYISADAKLFEAFSLNIVESALTGESLPVLKMVGEINSNDNVPLAERFNQIFAGTYVSGGRGVAIVTAIAKETELGKINQLINEQQTQLTPLQIKLNKLSKIFGISGVVLLIITTLIQILLSNIFSGHWNNPEVYSNAVIIGISLAVAAIPEGLITFTTVLLAIGVSRMTKDNVIIKSFPEIETLGSTSIICSDKTGTLTENKMTVGKFYDANNPNCDLEKSQALGALVGCCDASVTLNPKGKYIEVGDPTETGILRFGLQNNNSAEMFYQAFNKIDSIPFDNERKMMSILVRDKNDNNIIITKGAPDVIFAKSKDTTDEHIHLNEKWSQQSYRVIAVAYKNLGKNIDKITLDDENNFNFLGLIGMIDPPRSGVKESIAEARLAGIKPIMITGDHLTTAVAIAKDLGIYKSGDNAINGTQLAAMTDEELNDAVVNISVYARVSPNDKLRIVKAWQAHHHVVAMTGDGVNDAPALKASDIGVAMGMTGTDVSKQAADVILTDDNFTTIVKGVRSGRETFDRIKTVILNLLISSLTEIIVMVVGLFVLSFIFKEQIKTSEIVILSASQLLWINLLTHGLPAIALGMTPLDANVMQRQPFHKSESIFSRGMGWQLLIQSFIIAIAGTLAYIITAVVATQNKILGKEFVELTSTAMFITVGVAASINSINLMSQNSIFKCSILKYKLVYAASSFSLLCILFVAFVPGVREVFKMVNISELVKNGLYSPAFWIAPILLGFSLTIYLEIVKLIKHIKTNKIKYLLN